MKYEISMSGSRRYIKVRVDEVINAELEREFSYKTIQEAKKHNIKNFLVDVRNVSNVAGNLENYVFAYKNMRQFGLEKDSKIAVLVNPDDKSHDFIETVFRNAGYSCVIFTDEKTAIDWLEE
jgi:hypothetical protein